MVFIKYIVASQDLNERKMFFVVLSYSTYYVRFDYFDCQHQHANVFEEMSLPSVNAQTMNLTDRMS